MAKSIRTYIKDDINKAEAHLLDSMQNIATAIGRYTQHDVPLPTILEIAQRVNIICFEQDIQNPMEVYRELYKHGHAPDIGKYPEYVFALASIYITLDTTNQGIAQYKLEEKQIAFGW